MWDTAAADRWDDGAAREALAEVVSRLHGRMLAVARRVLRDEEDARDAVQDAYLQALRGLARFDRRASLGTWVHRVVVNAARMRLRARRRHAAEPFDELAPPPALATALPPGPDEALECRRTEHLVRRSVAALPRAHRLVLELRDLEEREAAEVARRLGVTRNALKTRAHRARRALRERLAAVTPAARPRRADRA